MSIFRSNFSAPGKGVSKEEAQERNYFDILIRKFWKLIQANLLYVLVNIIFFGAFVFLLLPFLFSSAETLSTITNSLILPVIKGEMMLPFIYFVPFLFIGPSTAGLTYITRNYARQEHAFICSDFFKTMKKNFKQSFFMGILLTVTLYLYSSAVIFYLNSMGYNIITLLLCGVSGIILASISFYVYPIMITFDMSFFDILKNSVLLTFGRLFQNIFILIIIALVHLLILWFAAPAWFILMILFLISWSSFTINYYTWNVINKHMIMENSEENEN